MSTTIVAVFINLLTVILPLLGITIGTEQLTVTAQTLIAIATGIWIWRERVLRGDVNSFGARK